MTTETDIATLKQRIIELQRELAEARFQHLKDLLEFNRFADHHKDMMHHSCLAIALIVQGAGGQVTLTKSQRESDGRGLTINAEELGNGVLRYFTTENREGTFQMNMVTGPKH